MRRRTPAVVLFVAAITLLGCQKPPQPRIAVFDPAEYAPFSRTGTGAVEGQAFMKTLGGDVKVAAGNEIILTPVTSYSTEYFTRYVKAYEPLEPADARAGAFTRIEIGDGEGRFRFEGLPAGKYYVYSYIEWYVDRTTTSGGIAHAEVTVHDGEVTRAVVTR